MIEETEHHANPGDIAVAPSLRIPSTELQFRFSRSGGKGGQNVNKVETKVELLFDVANSPSLSGDQRALLLRKLSDRLDSSGVLHIVAQTSRSQWKNREEAVAKFVAALQKALKPSKRRIKTKATAGSKERRLTSKKKRGEVKKMRRVID